VVLGIEVRASCISCITLAGRAVSELFKHNHMRNLTLLGNTSLSLSRVSSCQCSVHRQHYIPTRSAYGVYVSTLVPYARAGTHAVPVMNYWLNDSCPRDICLVIFVEHLNPFEDL
jgi:hypothetical protein